MDEEYGHWEQRLEWVWVPGPSSFVVDHLRTGEAIMRPSRARPKRRGPIWVEPSRGMRQPHHVPQAHPLDVCRRGRTLRSEHGSREAQNGDERC